MAATFETVTATGLPPIIGMDSLTVGADQAVRTASFALDPTWNQWPEVGDPVSVNFSKTLMLTGYVRDVRPAHSATSFTLNATVCSRTVDATECSCDHDGGEIRQKDLKAIGKELDKLALALWPRATFRSLSGTRSCQARRSTPRFLAVGGRREPLFQIPPRGN